MGGIKKLILKILIFFLKIADVFLPRQKKLPESPQTILLVMCHWLGDTFWAMQCIPALQKKYPNARIYAAVKPFSVSLFHGLLPPENVLIFKGIVSDRTREKFCMTTFRQNLKTARSLH